MIYGTQLKTKIDPDKNNTTGGYFLYAKAGGTAHLGAVAQNTVIGTYQRTESKFLTDYYYVKLANPVTSGGKTYNYAYVQAAKVYAYTPNLKKYYATKTSVNMRSSPSVIKGNIVGVLLPSELAGSSDGTKSSGFIRITRPDGSTVWVSANYLTTTAPAGASGTDGGTDPTDTDTVNNPADSTKTERRQTTVENTVGDSGTSVLKWFILGLGVCLFSGLLIRYLVLKNRKAKGK